MGSLGLVDLDLRLGLHLNSTQDLLVLGLILTLDLLDLIVRWTWGLVCDYELDLGLLVLGLDFDLDSVFGDFFGDFDLGLVCRDSLKLTQDKSLVFVPLWWQKPQKYSRSRKTSNRHLPDDLKRFSEYTGWC